MNYSLYHECLVLLVTIDEYNKCIALESNYIDDILDKCRLVCVLFSCMKYKIIIGIFSILDKSKIFIKVNFVKILSVNYDDDTLNIKLLNSFNLNEVK